MVKKMKKMNEEKVNLPGDIIESNILKRLPIKTLIRFTSVCKSWYSLLSNPYFINLQNQMLQENNNFLLVDSSYDGKINIVVKDRCSKKKLSSFSDISKFPYESVKVVGCHNGIVCVSFNTETGKQTRTGAPTRRSTVEYGISLWNPALRINKKIVVNYEPIDSFRGLPCVGFGYHVQTNDCKVVRFYNNNYLRLDRVEIYSLTSDSWRNIKLGADQLLNGHYLIEKSGVYVPGGAYCWLAYRCYCESIISFHIEDESFKEITLPYTSTGYRRENTLFIYKDSLAVLHTRNSDASKNHSPRICYIWMMNEYDDPKSWTMLFKFDSPYYFVSLVGVVATDSILLLCCDRLLDGELNVVDIDKSQMKPTTSYTKDIKWARWVSSFTESLALFTYESSFKY